MLVLDRFVSAFIEFLIIIVIQQCNLAPRVLRLFGQRVGARRDSGELNYNFFYRLPRKGSPGDKPLAKEPEDSGYEFVNNGVRVRTGPNDQM